MEKETTMLLRAVRFLLFLLLVTPLVFWREFIYYYVSTKIHFVFLVSQLVVILFVWLAWKYPQYRPRFSRIGRGLLFFLAILLLSSITGVDPFFSFWSDFSRSAGGLMWLHLVALFVVATTVFQTQKDWYHVFFVSTLVGLCVTIVHFLSRFDLNLFVNAMSGSTLGNSTFFGTYLLFQIFFSVYLFTESKARSLRVYAVGSILIFSIALFSIQANAARLSFIGGVVLLAALLLIHIGKSRVQRICGYGTLGGLVLLFVIVSSLLFQPNSRVHQLFVERSSGARFVVWDMAWQGVKERPWLGWGPENFEYVALKYFNPCLGSVACGGEMWFDRAHNILLDVAVDSGLIGLATYLFIFLCAIVHVWKPKEKRIQKSAIPAIFTTILVVYFMQNLTSLDSMTSLLFFVLLLSAMSSFNHTTFFEEAVAAQPEKKAVSVVAPLLATGLFPFLFFFFVFQPIQSNRSTLQAIAPQSMEQHLLDYEQALTGSYMGLDSRRAYLANDTAKFLWVSSPEGVESVAPFARQEIQMAEEALLDTIGRPHENLRSYLYLGKLYQIEARLFDETLFQKAQEILQRAVQLSQDHQLPKWILAGVYLEQGKIIEAVELTEEALALDPRVVRSHMLNLITLRFLGDERRLAQAAETAVQMHPALVTRVEELLFIQDLEASKVSLLYQFVL